MSIFENIRMAFKSLRDNKMRSFLTMLGIIIGIGSVIMIISAGNGGKQAIMGQLESIGSNSVSLNVSSKEANDNDYITFDDIEAIKEKAPHLKYISPQINYYGEMVYNGESVDAVCASLSQDGMEMSGYNMVAGRFFNEEEYLAGRNVIVLDSTTAQNFFGNLDVVGMTVDLTIERKTVKFKIVGVYEMSNSFMMGGMPYAMPCVPATTLINMVNADPTFNSVMMTADDKANTEAMGNAAINIMEARHGNRGRDLYQAQSMIQQVDAINTVITLFQTFIAAVAAISLLVGGIGVMNIMLVAVTERTREIGIKKSLGAKTSTIMFQFLTESAILTLVGGAIGLALGMLGSWGICSLLGVTPAVTLSAVGGVLFFSAAVGIFFGIYPARKAARLHPIEALRHQ